jgi:hypothetical protein
MLIANFILTWLADFWKLNTEAESSMPPVLEDVVFYLTKYLRKNANT